MNRLFFFTFCYAVRFIYPQNNLIIFSESTDFFQAEYKNKIIPDIPQTDLKITGINTSTVSIKIIFANKNLTVIDTIVSLYHLDKPTDHQDIIYSIQKDNKTIRYLASLPSSDIKPIIPELDTSIVVKTREEKTIQQIIFLNDSNQICLTSIDSADFTKVLKYIDHTPNIDRKIVLIENFLKYNCLNTQQAEAIIERAPFEVERLKIIKQIFFKLTTVFELNKWKDYLKTAVAEQSFLDAYAQFLLDLKNNPSITDSLLQVVYQKLQAKNNDFDKINELKILFSHFSVSIHSLEKLISLLQHDQHKVEILKMAYYTLPNKSDFPKTYGFVHFNESKEQLKQFYEKQKK